MPAKAEELALERHRIIAPHLKAERTLRSVALDAGLPCRTTLILIDEADRLGMNSLEQVRSVFDAGNIGVVLIGMPGVEKRMARFPQFYSRIGFVHHYRPLAPAEVESLLAQGWAPDGINLSGIPFDGEASAS